MFLHYNFFFNSFWCGFSLYAVIDRDYAPFYFSATDEDFYSSLAQMAGEDFDGDDDDEVTKMGVCRVHACLQEWHTGFQVPKGIGSRLSG